MMPTRCVDRKCAVVCKSESSLKLRFQQSSFVREAHLSPGESEKIRKHRPKVIAREFRQMKNTNFHQLNNDLHDAPWYVGDIFNNIDDQYGYWYALFKSVGKDHAPLKRKRVRVKDVPYTT